MKVRIAFAALFAAGAADMAVAQTGPVDRVIPVDGTVAGVCRLGPPSRPSVPLGTLVNTSGPRVGRLTAITPQTVSLPNSWCNFAGTAIRVSADAMLASNAAAPQPGIARAVNFTSTVANWAASNAVVTTAASAGGGTPSAQGTGATQPLPRIADLVVTVENFAVPADAFLVAGNYAGAVTITLGPAATP